MQSFSSYITINWTSSIAGNSVPQEVLIHLSIYPYKFSKIIYVGSERTKWTEIRANESFWQTPEQNLFLYIDNNRFNKPFILTRDTYNEYMASYFKMMSDLYLIYSF